MFVCASTLVLAIAASAIAAPGGAPTSQCDTGTMQCCVSTTTESNASESVLALLGGLNLGSVQGLLGTGCSPISAVATGSGAICQQQPVCCTNVSQNGLVNFGCSPLDLNL